MTAAQDHLLSFDGQVAIVTGAGGGMGRAYAIGLAERGARVVINDYGGDMFGSGGNPGAAESVAAEIRALGAEAIATSSAVGTADAAREITQYALASYGRIDVLINNAGISASGPIDGPSDERAERAFRTNLLAPYHLMRAVWPIMRAQSYGRILNISSNAALGMGGSAIYAAGKAGLIGLTLDAAQEGAVHGIFSNALMPTAYSRMIEAVPDRLFVDWMRETLPAAKVAAAAIYLVSAQSQTNGHIFSVGGGRMARLAWFEAPGLLDLDISPESVGRQILQACDMDGAELIESQQAEIGLYMRAFPMADGRTAQALQPSAFAERKLSE